MSNMLQLMGDADGQVIRAYMGSLGRKGGPSTSAAKIAASRRNGKRAAAKISRGMKKYWAKRKAK